MLTSEYRIFSRAEIFKITNLYMKGTGVKRRIVSLLCADLFYCVSHSTSQFPARRLAMPKSLSMLPIGVRIIGLSSGIRSLSIFPRLRTANGTFNQIFSTEADSHLHEINKNFEGIPIVHTFGYGSGVFLQAGYDVKASNKPQIDLVHIVENPIAFHEQNSTQHASHYSGLLKCGIGAVSVVQLLGAGVYFNPYVPMSDDTGNTSMIKYGVVSKEDAIKDITEWSTMYIAGRLQKPVKHFGTNECLLKANDYNLASAFNLALLLLPKKKKDVSFTEASLYEKIALLSYMGDPRMLVGGENPNKVKNIVSKQAEKFTALYQPFLTEALEKGVLVRNPDSSLQKKLDLQAVAAVIAGLPLQFKRRLLRSYRKKYQKILEADNSMKCFLNGESNDVLGGEYIDSVARDSFLRATLKASVLATIAYPALVQSIKGIFTAGLVKSAKYAWEKKIKSRAAESLKKP